MVDCQGYCYLLMLWPFASASVAEPNETAAAVVAAASWFPSWLAGWFLIIANDKQQKQG